MGPAQRNARRRRPQSQPAEVGREGRERPEAGECAAHERPAGRAREICACIPYWGESARRAHTCVAFPRVMSGVMLPTLIGKIARKVRGAVPRLPLSRDICAHIVPRGVGNDTQKGENWAQSARKLCERRRPHFARFHGVCGSPPRCVVLDSVGCATARSLFARRTRRPAAIKGTMTQWHNGARTICPSSQYGLVEQLYCLGSSRP